MVSPMAGPFDPRAIRPARYWYVVAGLIAAVLFVSGVVIFGVQMTSLARGLPKMTVAFAPDVPTTVELSADRTSAVYVDAHGLSPADVACTGRGLDGGQITVDAPGGAFVVGRWLRVARITVSTTGRYTITCRPASPDIVVSRFAVADDVDTGPFVGKAFGGFGALLGLPCIGLITGGVIVLVVALRRQAARRNLAPPMPPYTVGSYGAPFPAYHYQPQPIWWPADPNRSPAPPADAPVRRDPPPDPAAGNPPPGGSTSD